jgi:membrane protease YdiL (CAAX protease family)
VSGLSVWLRIAGLSGLAVVLSVLIAPSAPVGRLSWLAAAEVGAAGGAILFALALRRPPRLAVGAASLPAFMARQGLLGVWAATEELIWRRVLLGELLFGGALAALAASSLGFALVHRRRGLHLATGAAFGGLYIATGALAASIAAHWTYNMLVADLVDRSRRT